MKSSLFNSLKLLISFWQDSAEPWGAKDHLSRFIYANPRYHKLLALPAHFSIEGRLDGELPAPTAEFQAAFQLHDRKVEMLQDRITSVEIHPFEGHTYFQPWFFDKYPLLDKTGISRGTIFHGRPVEHITLTHLSKIKTPTSLVFSPPSDMFTTREWEVLFYVLHGFSSIDTAQKLHLSPRTICNITQSIYKKSGVCNRRSIIEYCHEKEIGNYVPQSFFEHSGSFPSLSH